MNTLVTKNAPEPIGSGAFCFEASGCRLFIRPRYPARLF
jgi:hypothetical protein